MGCGLVGSAVFSFSFTDFFFFFIVVKLHCYFSFKELVFVPSVTHRLLLRKTCLF